MLVLPWPYLIPALTSPSPWPGFGLDLALTLHWPFLNLALTLPCLDLALTLPWPCLDPALTLPWPYLDLALTLLWHCIDLALTLPRTWLKLANLPLKFGQNRVSNSWDIPDMDKCQLDKCWLDKCHRDSWDVLRMVPGTYVYSFVKIGSVTAEILLTLSFCGWWWVGCIQRHFHV